MDESGPVYVEDLGAVALRPQAGPIYPTSVDIAPLLSATGAAHFLVRYPGGTEALPHRHTQSQTIIVLEGRLRVNDRELGPGAYCHLPARQVMIHTSADQESCLFLTIFDGPFDVEVVTPA